MMLIADNDVMSFSGLARSFANTLLYAEPRPDVAEMMTLSTFRVHEAADNLLSSVRILAEELGMKEEEAFVCAVYRIAYETHVIPELQGISLKQPGALSAWFNNPPILSDLSKEAGDAIVLANNNFGFDPILF